MFFWAATPLLMSLLTFGLFVLLGHQLTAATVFTSLALFNTLIAPLNSFPWVLNGVVEAGVSLGRLRRYAFLLQPPVQQQMLNDIFNQRSIFSISCVRASIQASVALKSKIRCDNACRFLVAEETKADWAYLGWQSAELAAPSARETSFEFDPPPTPTFETPLLRSSRPSPFRCDASLLIDNICAQSGALAYRCPHAGSASGRRSR